MNLFKYLTFVISLGVFAQVGFFSNFFEVVPIPPLVPDMMPGTFVGGVMNIFKVLVAVVLSAVFLFHPVKFASSAIPEKPVYEYAGDGVLIFYNTHTDELLKITYKSERGRYIEDGLENIAYILRCRLTGESMPMDMKLVELVDHIQDHFGGGEIEIISGYRSSELNQMLKSAGRGVAGKSLHMKGMAVDIRIPGISTRELRDYAISLKAGGVGYYPGPDFVHVDVGQVRNW